MTVPPDLPPIYLASIALEPNRWKKPGERVPSYKVSEWSSRALSAGFDGWEIWEPHIQLADSSEQEALIEPAIPIRVFNTYLRPGTDSDTAWKRVAETVQKLGPQVIGLKFNLGGAEVPAGEQIEAAVRWAAILPSQVRMLCECHPGTILETPEAAAKAFADWPADRFGAILHPLSSPIDRTRAWLEALGDRIEHLHWQGRNEERRVIPLLSAGEAFHDSLKTLRQHGFKGSQSIEFVEGTGRPGESVESLFAAAVVDLVNLREAFPMG